MATINSTFALTAKLDERHIYMFHYNCTSLREVLDEFWHKDWDQLKDLEGSGKFPIDIVAMPDQDGQVENVFHLEFICSVFNHFFDKGWSATSAEPDEYYTFDQFLKDIARTNTIQTVQPMPQEKKANDVTSFFFYMWNAWCEEECKKAFSASGNNCQHFWNKWLGICKEHSVYGAAERFYAELSCHNRDLLVKRATEVYEGDSEKQ